MHDKQATPPVGIATKLGLGTVAAAAIPVIVDLFNSDAIDNPTRRLLIIVAAAIAAVLIVARSAQAIALELAGRRIPPSGPTLEAFDARIADVVAEVAAMHTASVGARAPKAKP